MKFLLFNACEGAGWWVIGTAVILLLFIIQSIWGIVDSQRPENPVSQSLKNAGVYKAMGGQGAAGGGGDNKANIDVGGTVFSVIMLCLSVALAGFFVKGVMDCNNLAAFNPFRKLGR